MKKRLADTNEVRVIEVGPRDGFQNLKDFIPTEKKIKEIELLIASGIKEIEVTSFVHPKAIPQMADAAEVASYIAGKYSDIRLMALVPNKKGAENAIKCGIQNVAYVISASEAHNKANVNRAVEESLADVSQLMREFPELKVRVDVATAFGCPYEGIIPEDKVFRIVDQVLNGGAAEIVLCDTIGVANPLQVRKLCESFAKRYPDEDFALHLHDTRGLGLANAYAALDFGVRALETSVGGLGGCPFAPGAAGNTATEDLLNMLNSMGMNTGVDYEKYMEAVDFAAQNIKKNLTSRMYHASCRI